ncbi:MULTISPECIES: ABC transporter permease [Rhizobium/Agrobacterium group]|uniref:ABC transporter permease n=1 Tax=Rhizobium/Agrobacterium group TaxID=227290 RepID=UPI00107F2C7F|nr:MULTISPECIES: ABC transporter permease [Rhizobium/Agrobacterium group]MBB4402780.1 ribose transport system permease protein [Agrobacterium radiobacter]MBB5589309.1 ribose transport system permease protein [Agrobacterium radiobacter]TGE85868.1 ABC transporter permease [Rhizobium sp. SEMIA 4032]
MSTEIKALNAKPESEIQRRSWRSNWRDYVVYIGFVVIFIVFAILLQDRGFLSSNNLLNILRQTAIVAIVAMAMSFVLSAGEIDLSVGAIAGLSSVVAGIALMQYGLVPGILAGLALGLLVGAINGTLTSYLNIPSFLVTLGMMGIARGVGMWVSGTSPVPIVDDTFVFVFGSGNIGPVPVLVIWVAVLGTLAHVALRKTPFGRKVMSAGGNSVAARYSGINVRKIKFQVLLLTGVAASIAGMLYAGRLQSGRFQLGEGDELSVIAAVVLGGTSLFGGRGTVIGSIVGALLIGVINNGLILGGLDYSQQLIARGLLIILAVALGRSR